MNDDSINKALNKAILLNRIYAAAVPGGLAQALVQTFLIAARYEGSTVNEIKNRVDGNLSTVSRQLLDLSDTLRTGEAGYGLLERIRSPTDRRSVIFVLTEKGRGVASQVRDVMEA